MGREGPATGVAGRQAASWMRSGCGARIAMPGLISHRGDPQAVVADGDGLLPVAIVD